MLTPMHIALLVVVVLSLIHSCFRNRQEREEDTRLAELRYLVRVCFEAGREKWEGAEAIYWEKTLIGAVRLTSVRRTAEGVEAKVTTIPSPGLFPGERSWTIGSAWVVVYISPDQWCSSPYVCWQIFFDSETIRTVKAMGEELACADERLRHDRLVEYLRQRSAARRDAV